CCGSCAASTRTCSSIPRSPPRSASTSRPAGARPSERGSDMPMERRRLGNTDMVVSPLGFGGSEIGYQAAAPRTGARLLASAIDAGLNVIDTAECYDDSEALIGQALGPRRRDVYLLTKCGHARGWRANWRPSALLSSIERSLTRLRTDHLDLIQLHSCS